MQEFEILTDLLAAHKHLDAESRKILKKGVALLIDELECELLITRKDAV